jgi:hypothetical protein
MSLRPFGKGTTSVVPKLPESGFGFSRCGWLFTPQYHTLQWWIQIWRDGWCREQDLNLHAFWALDPKSNASANSAIPACPYFN